MKRIQHKGDVNHKDFPHGKLAGYRANCKCVDCINANREYKKVYTANLRKSNPIYAEAQREDKRKFRKTSNGRALYRSMNRKRRELIKSISDTKLIRLIYLYCPNGYTVDHIIPLSKGGLHLSENLQYLPASINSAKSNKLDFNYHTYAILWQSIIK